MDENNNPSCKYYDECGRANNDNEWCCWRPARVEAIEYLANLPYGWY